MLDRNSIQHAIKEIKAYERDIERKTNTLRTRLATQMAMLTSRGFASAVADTSLRGLDKGADVTIEVDDQANVSIVMASGPDAIWAEFGAGVYYNGPAGSSPHPKGSELGFTIGGYGKGNGKKETWGYISEGELVLTHGTPASMPMFKAMQAICAEVESVAREVFR